MANKRHTSLRENLKELENPAVSVFFNDPENDDDIFTSAKLSSLNENIFDEKLLDAKIGSLRNRIGLKDDQLHQNYCGKKISRVDLEDSEQNSIDSEHSFIDEETDCGHSDEGDEDNENNEYTLESEVDDVGNKEESSTNHVTCFQDDDSINTFNVSNVEHDLQKGDATKKQLALLDKLLEERIRLQKSLQLTNQLPQHESMGYFRGSSSLNANSLSEEVVHSLKQLLDKLLSLQAELFARNADTSNILHGNVANMKSSDEEIASETDGEEEEDKKETPSSDVKIERKNILMVSEYEKEISKRHCIAKGYHETVIDKWYNKTRISSGKITNKNFNAFDKSTLQQINQVLADKPRLVRRTQLRRTPYKIIGKRAEEDMITTEMTDPHLKDYDVEVFDDSDFYHEMLKELIERKANIDSMDPVAAGRQWLELQKMRTKIKRKIDTRASKGRKVRYDLHPKLVNFMAPENAGKMSDQARNDLFSSLFGKLRAGKL